MSCFWVMPFQKECQHQPDQPVGQAGGCDGGEAFAGEPGSGTIDRCTFTPAGGS